METLDNMFVSNWSNVRSSVPPSYIQPIENRPGNVISSSCKAIPVIDFGGHDRDYIAKYILKASEEFGFFQVSKITTTSLSHSLYIFRMLLISEVVGKYTQELRKLGLKILELLCEGIGLDQEYFCGELVENPALTAHHYPPCPNPSLTLGVVKHRDPSIITILLQDEKVHGLQVHKDGEWIEVEPIPNAFVVNIGLLLQIISNGRLIGAEHRVVTNSSTPRTSVAYFIYPSPESIIEPSKDLVNENNAPIYKSMTFGEFRMNFFNKGANIEAELLS
ncbi:unnamed protein product [Lupinus luteus]|uniref:Fe2OG dioxygenase domain-containing protein n=1 Tax=Lupinus luteus TaxID=3873 RepID=A0AAV1X6R9_LUPLU